MRSFFFLILTVVLVSCNPSESVDQPNVILILTDDQGWGDLSSNGNQSLSTPNIDKLAQSGVTFDRFFVSAVCSPTRAEILTGRYAARGGVFSTSAGGERLDLDETTVAEIFKQAGYKTAAYGKWHNGMQPPYHPNARGFEDFYGFCSGHWGNYFSPMLEHNGEIVKGEGFLVDDLTNHGIDFIEENQEQPFFLYLPLNTPHSPMQVPDRWWDKFKDAEIAQGGTLADREKIEHTRAALAMCENIDWNVGRIIEKLETLELTDHTIVIYLSDNGPNGHRWNGEMKGIKGSVDEGGVRSPLIMTWPTKLPAGSNVEQIASGLDLLPTLMDMASISMELEKPLDGVSLKPLLMERNQERGDRMIINHWRNRTSVRSQNYRLSHEGYLFDMINDPGQTRSVAIEKPEVFNRLMDAKLKWEEEVLGELYENESRPFPIGHPEFEYTQIPARDGTAHGNIERSNRWPNCSFFTNWIDLEDKVTWEAEVLADGDFEVEIYYTCPEEAIGSVIELSFGEEKLQGQIREAHDPELRGAENDRFERGESLVKDFKALKMGTIHLSKGINTLELKALEIPGSQVMDFRLLMFKKV